MLEQPEGETKLPKLCQGFPRVDLTCSKPARAVKRLFVTDSSSREGFVATDEGLEIAWKDSEASC